MAEDKRSRRNKPGEPFVCIKCDSAEHYTATSGSRTCKPCQKIRTEATRVLSSKPGIQNRSDRPFKCRKCGSTDHLIVNLKSHVRPKRYCRPCKNARYTPLKRRVYAAGPESPAMKARREVSRQLWTVITRGALIKLSGGKCQKCGYSRNTAAMHFHHLDESKKAFNINTLGMPQGKMAARKLRLAEWRKCALLCANCHGETTWPQFNKKIPKPKWNFYENESFVAWCL